MGTKIQAAAAKRHTLSLSQIERELADLESQVRDLLVRAETADQASDEGDQLPQDLTDCAPASGTVAGGA